MKLRFPQSSELPYVFDLLYDIKTVEELHKELRILSHSIMSLQETMEDEDIPFPTDYVRLEYL